MMTAAVVVLALGVCVLVLGLRGRRVGDEPRCRRCGFDLTGLASGTGLCPECGRSVAEARARVVGRRRWDRGRIVAAGVLVLVSAGLGWFAVSRNGMLPYTPSRVLAAYTQWTERDLALDELRARLEAGRLGPGSVRMVVAAALALQADLKRPWDERWGSFVERATLTPGLVRPEDERRYLKQVYHGDFGVRTRTLVGWGAVAYSTYGVRCGRGRPVYLLERRSYGFGDKLTRESSGGDEPISSGTTSFSMSFAGRGKMPSVAVGDYIFTWETEVWIGWERIKGGKTGPAEAPLVHNRREFAVNVAATPEEAVTFKPDEPAPAITVATVVADSGEQLFRARRLHPTSSEWNQPVADLAESSRVTVAMVSVSGASLRSMKIAHDVYIVLGGVEMWVGQLVSDRTLEWNSGAVWNDLVIPRDAANVDVILRSSWSAALSSIETFDVAGGEIRIPSVPIERRAK